LAFSNARETELLDQGASGWHKASFSADQSDCVEVGACPSGDVAVRDTKALGAGDVLGFTVEAWTAFVAELKNGRFAV
jgi:hypothetical protein